jgi:hypothetical protein
MCRNNFIFLILWLAVSIVAGAFFASIIANIFQSLTAIETIFINLICMVTFALFLLPALNRFTS